MEKQAYKLEEDDIIDLGGCKYLSGDDAYVAKLKYLKIENFNQVGPSIIELRLSAVESSESMTVNLPSYHQIEVQG